eukprot:TRINITY_DN6887_c0_g1_i1.p1 TRINITY_DN6887_c0_g1~~TRINITY_DN6887_c0_g1_i1.p1  ORF type:complete len:473 (+),score=108.85 TRINITY_DN6887_c0_g1_i1:150-1568(+)
MAVTQAPRAGWMTTTVNLANLALGSGLLAIPSAVQTGGVAWTVTWMVVFATVSAITLNVIQKAIAALSTEHKQHIATFTHAVKLAFGDNAELALSILIMLKLYGTGIAYLIVVGDSLEPLTVAAYDDKTDIPWYLQRQALITYFTLVIVLPLSLFRTLTSLRYFSGLGVAAILYTASFVSTDAAVTLDSHPAQFRWVASGWDLFKPIGVLVLAFGCQLQSPQVFAEIADPEHEQDNSEVDAEAGLGATKDSSIDHPIIKDAELLDEAIAVDETTVLLVDDNVRQSTSPLPAVFHRRLNVMNVAIVLTMLISFCLQASTGILATLAYRDIPGNVLNRFSPTKLPVVIARVAIAIAVTLTYPLVHSTARWTAYGLYCRYKQQSLRPPSRLAHVLLTIVYVATTWAVALVITDVGVVLAVIGSAAGILTNYTIPALLVVRSNSPWQNDKGAKMAGWVLVACSIPLAVFGITTVFL